MTGRDKFSRWKPVLTFVTRLMKNMPASLWEKSWFLWRDTPGKLGVGIRYLYVATLSRACGDNVMVGRGCEMRDMSGLCLGSNVTIHLNTFIDAAGGVTIGDNVSIAHGCSILSFEHTWEDPKLPIKYNPLKLSPVIIRSDVWLGCGARVLAGADIGSRTVVAAGAVVSRGEYPAGIYGGVPARLIKAMGV